MKAYRHRVVGKAEQAEMTRQQAALARKNGFWYVPLWDYQSIAAEAGVMPAWKKEATIGVQKKSAPVEDASH